MGKIGAFIGAILFIILFRGDISRGGGFYLFSAVLGGVIIGGIAGSLLGFILKLFSKDEAIENELNRMIPLQKHRFKKSLNVISSKIVAASCL